MRIEITTKNYRLDDVLKELIIKKLNKFDKYFGTEAKAKVKLSTVGKDQYIMEINVDGSNMGFARSVVSGDKMNENLDKVLPKLEKQIVKYRDKFGSKFKKAETPVIYEENVQVDEKSANVVRVKKFEISVTSVDNAIEEMELLNHAFYVFVNGDTNKVSVLYKRNDGDYGLIEPEY
ncbi:ribosome-associated translation inhibitor RaiA [bacterium]|nr:ribosome-associated translation inhibitor RaiA [bacterium]